jgi:hypothetical protein
VIVFYDDINLRKVFFDNGLQIAEADRLEPHIGIVEILDWRLDEENLHGLGRATSVPLRSPIYTRIQTGAKCPGLLRSDSLGSDLVPRENLPVAASA